LLRLVLEDRLDLETQFLLRERDEPGGLGDGPLLPRAAIQPDLRTPEASGGLNTDALRRRLLLSTSRGLRRHLLLACGLLRGVTSLRAVQLAERTIDCFLTHAVRAVRIGEIARDEDQIGLMLLDELTDDLDVGGAHR